MDTLPDAYVGHFNNYFDPRKCRGSVADGGRSPLFHQCSRKPSVYTKAEWYLKEKGKVSGPYKKVIGEAGWCKTHAPKEVTE